MSADWQSIWRQCVDNLVPMMQNDQDGITILRAPQLRDSDGKLQLVTLNNIAKKQIEKNLAVIRFALQAALPEAEKHRAAKLGVVLEEGDLFNSKSAAKPKAAKRFDSHLNPNYLFENFIAGPSNDQAFAAAQRVGSGALDFNPLVIYGGTGLGKSHLMHAIGNALKRLGDREVLYITAETFVNDFIRTLNDKNRSMEDFAAQYRSVDALLIDDVQFLGGKGQSQTEFFHTFNALFDKNRLIILTCDRFPKEIDGLEERLKSRFGSGLSVSVTPPEFETRVAILHNKAEKLGFDLSSDVAMFIASHVVSNVRELEGALRSVYARWMIHKKPVSLEEAREVLKDHINAQQQQIPLDVIQKKTANYYRVSHDDMLGKSRKADIVFPRQVAMSLGAELTEHTPANVGKAFNRDRTTVLHAGEVIAEKLRTDPEFRKEYEGLKMIIKG